VTFLPARLGPWAAAGVSALDARASDPAIAIRLIFLLDIFLSPRRARSHSFSLTYYYYELWEPRWRGATSRRPDVADPFVYSSNYSFCSSPYRGVVLYLNRVPGVDKPFIQHCLFGAFAPLHVQFRTVSLKLLVNRQSHGRRRVRIGEQVDGKEENAESATRLVKRRHQGAQGALAC